LGVASQSPAGDALIPSGGDTTTPPADDGGSIAGVMAGAVGAVGVLALLVGVWVWWRCRRPHTTRSEDTDPLPGASFELPGLGTSFELRERNTGGGKSFLPGAAAALGGCVLTGTFLGLMGESSLEGLLAAGEALPFVGEVCSVLLMLKHHVDDYHDAEEECCRLSVLIEH